jgi:ATP-binding cassette, subfamily B, multidrug efflux pump
VGTLRYAEHISVGEVVAFILYAKMFAGPLESIANGLSMMQNTFASAARVFAMLDLPEIEEMETKRKLLMKGTSVLSMSAFLTKKTNR